jgi:hypothetical protein
MIGGDAESAIPCFHSIRNPARARHTIQRGLRKAFLQVFRCLVVLKELVEEEDHAEDARPMGRRRISVDVHHIISTVCANAVGDAVEGSS